MGLGRRAAALAQVAGRAGRRHIFPCRAAAKRARDDVIEGEVVVRSAILAAEAVEKEEVEPGEGGMRGGTDILAKRDDRRQPHGAAGAVDFTLILRDDIDTFQERGLDGGHPRRESCSERVSQNVWITMVTGT